MKLTTFLAATFATAAVAVQAGGVVFNTPVIYTEAEAQAAANPVMLERVIVTPSRTYAEREWYVHLASKQAAPQLYPVRSERRLETRSHNTFRIFLPLQ